MISSIRKLKIKKRKREIKMCELVLKAEDGT